MEGNNVIGSLEKLLEKFGEMGMDGQEAPHMARDMREDLLRHIRECIQALGTFEGKRERQERELHALISSSRDLLQIKEFSQAARAIFDSCKTLTGATAGYVALLSEDGNENEVLFLDAGGRSCDVDSSLPMPIRGLREEAYRTGKTVYENDFSRSAWAGFLPDGHVHMDNVLFAPLPINGKVVGVIGLANKPGPFTKEDARIATTLGEHAAIALRNSRTLDELEGRVRERTADLVQMNERMKEEIRDRERVEKSLRDANNILNALSSAQAGFISETGLHELFDALLNQLLSLTQSEYGFIGKVHYTGEKKIPYLKTHAITNIAWNDETRLFYERNIDQGLEFHNLNTLFGEALKTGRVVIANTPASDPRRGGFPGGHPPMNSFLCLPLYYGYNLVGIAGIANRPGGYDQELVDYLAPYMKTCALIIHAAREHQERIAAEEELRQNLNLQLILNTIMSVAQEEIPLNGILEKVLEHLFSIPWLSVESMGCIFLKEESDLLVMKARRGIPQAVQENCAAVPIGKCFCGRAAAERRIQFSTSIDEDHEIRYEGILPHGHYCVPVCSSDVVIGVLCLYLKEGYHPGRDDETFLNAVANCLAGIIMRKRAETLLQESNSLLQAVFDGIAEPLSLLDQGLHIRGLNRAALDYYGANALKDVIGKPCHLAMRASETPCDGCQIVDAVRSGNAACFEQNGFMDPQRVEKVFIYPINEDPLLTGGAIIRINDITEARKIERHLIQNQKMIALGVLVAGIAHEINNPNNFIIFNIPILKDYLLQMLPIVDRFAADQPSAEWCGMPYPEFRKDLFRLIENMKNGSERITNIVNDLRQFSKKKNSIEIKPVEINNLITRIVNICHSKIKHMVRTFETKIPDMLPKIHTDPDIIEQVLMNCIINAAQAADKEDSWIRLEVKKEDSPEDPVIIELTDNGRGMDEETLCKVFDPFFTTKSPRESAGLGMYICHNLVQSISGRIEIESQPGKGSTIRVLLPAMEHQKPLERRRGGFRIPGKEPGLSGRLK